MGYKILGFLVWRVIRWELDRTLARLDRKAAMAGLGGLLIAGLVIGGAIAAQRSPDDS